MYESPIAGIIGEIQTKIMEAQDDYIMQVVHDFGVEVNKEELIKALNYDRNQYEKGYADAKAETQWIPCSERLPEKEGWYITTIESEKTRKRRIETDLFAVDIAISHGTTPYKFCKHGYRQKTIAWMPFPEPYKGEQV